ncbi:MAG: VOC family protein [Patescibacteria group bacterium]
MLSVTPYLTFNGNCVEAMNFYHQALGGELRIQKVNETPARDQMSAESQDKVMHASLSIDGNYFLMATDLTPPNIVQGNMIALCVNCETREEIETVFAKLSVGAQQTHPLKDEFWGDTYGEVIDKYGYRWMLNYHKMS